MEEERREKIKKRELLLSTFLPYQGWHTPSIFQLADFPDEAIKYILTSPMEGFFKARFSSKRSSVLYFLLNSIPLKLDQIISGFKKEKH